MKSLFGASGARATSRRLRDVWRHGTLGDRGGDGLTVCPKQLPLPPASELSLYYQLVLPSDAHNQRVGRPCIVSECTKPTSVTWKDLKLSLYVCICKVFSTEVEARSGGPRSGELPEARRRQREGASGVRGESSLRSFWASHSGEQALYSGL